MKNGDEGKNITLKVLRCYEECSKINVQLYVLDEYLDKQ